MQNRMVSHIFLSCLLCLCLLGVPSISTSSAQAQMNALHRVADPVVVDNSVLRQALEGIPIPNIRVLVFRNGQFGCIPFQVDERGPQGDLILTQGPLKGKERDRDGDYVDATSLGVFNGLDEVVFMAMDMGRRAPLETWPEGADRAVEILVLDPVDGSRAWAYICSLSDPPPLVNKDYIDYKTIEREKGKPEVHIVAEHYHAAFTDISKPVAQSDWQIRQGAWEGKDIMKTFRSIIDIHLGFIHFDFTLENIIPKRLGQIDGPVRVVRRIRNSVRFAGIPIPDFLVKKMAGAALDTDSFYYPGYFYFNGELSVPSVLVKYGKNSKAIFTTDFNSQAVGSNWMDEKNQDSACLIDGVMSPQEKALDNSLYKWALFHGEQGGWMNILTFGEGFRRLHIRLYYMDNAIDGFIPEGDPRLIAYGSTGYRVRDFQKILPGKPLVFTTNVFPIFPDYQKGDETGYINLIFHPLEVSATRSKKG